MSIIDAWDGRLWEQEQPLAVLLGQCLDPTSEYATAFFRPVTDAQTEAKVEVEAKVDATVTRPSDHDVIMTTAVRRSRGRKRSAEEMALLSDPVIQGLFTEEKELRRHVREEEFRFRRSLTRHRRDNGEFLQFLEKQAQRRRREFERDHRSAFTLLHELTQKKADMDVSS